MEDYVSEVALQFSRINTQEENLDVDYKSRQ